MNHSSSTNSTGFWEIVRQCVSRQLDSPPEMPPPELDLLEKELVDSMGWEEILSCLESATGIPDLGARWPREKPCSMRALVDLPVEGVGAKVQQQGIEGLAAPGPASEAAIAGWGHCLGSVSVDASQVDREYGQAEGTLQERAGIASLARAGPEESELTLALKACEQTGAVIEEIDLLLATSETYIGHPSLAATLHAQLLLRSTCAAMDVGGACVGLLHAFSVAQAMLCSGLRRTVLVVASEVHSRWLTADRVPWEFGALFGDGACAFLLRPAEAVPPSSYRLGGFLFGCETAFSGALGVALPPTGTLTVEFKGLALANVAVNRLVNLTEDLAIRNQISRSEFAGYAIHQPNPRLVEIFAQRVEVSPEKIPDVARNAGNLGSATCGVALCQILSQTPDARQMNPVLMAAVGPGLLWGGTWLYQAAGFNKPVEGPA